MKQYLHKIDLTLSTLNEDEAYYCSYQNPQAHVVELKNQFEDTIKSLKPLVSFLSMIQQAFNNNDVIRAGEILRLAEIQNIVENTPALEKQLDKIVSYSLFQSKSSGIDGKLKYVFKVLLGRDYLTQADSTRQIYVATSKWNLLLEQLRFINDNENLDCEALTDTQQTQNELL
jgi:hypothetical protein